MTATAESNPKCSPTPAPFFHLNADYVIAPSSKTENIGDDVLCLNESVLAVIQALIEATDGENHLQPLAFAALYMAEQASAAARAYYDQVQPTLSSMRSQAAEVAA